jgi:hypothetical protein
MKPHSLCGLKTRDPNQPLREARDWVPVSQLQALTGYIRAMQASVGLISRAAAAREPP